MQIDFHADLYQEPGYGEALAQTARKLGFDVLCIGGGVPQYGLATNDDVLREAEVYPDLFMPFARLSLGVEGAARVEELHRCGFQGLRLMAPPAPYDEQRFFPVYEAAQALQMPVMFHTGYVPVTPLDRALDVRCERMRPIHLDTIARCFPRLNIVGLSLGYPWCEEACETLRHHANVFFDLSGHLLRKKGPAYFQNLFWWEKNVPLTDSHTQNPWQRVLFGSAVKHEEIASVERDYQRLFRSLALGQSVIDAVMGGTAQRLLGLAE